MQIQLLDYVTNEGSNAEGAEALDVRHRREVFPHVRSQLDRVENDNSFRFAVPLVREGNTCTGSPNSNFSANPNFRSQSSNSSLMRLGAYLEFSLRKGRFYEGDGEGGR